MVVRKVLLHALPETIVRVGLPGQRHDPRPSNRHR